MHQNEDVEEENDNKFREDVENLKGAGWLLIRGLMCLDFRPLAVPVKRGDWNKMAKSEKKKKEQKNPSHFIVLQQYSNMPTSVKMWRNIKTQAGFYRKNTCK